MAVTHLSYVETETIYFIHPHLFHFNFVFFHTELENKVTDITFLLSSVQHDVLCNAVLVRRAPFFSFSIFASL